MSQTMKRLTVALLCVLLFVTAFSLAFFYGGTTAADASVQYEKLIVERQGQIYATDNSSDLIKERLSVYGVTAEGEQVLLDPSEYVVHLGGADGATSGWTLSTTQLNSFTVTAGSLSAGFSAVAAAVAPGSVKVTPDFTVRGDKNVATDDGSTLYLYTHDNVRDHITVVGYNNDGRPYNGTVEASVITDYVISGSTLPGEQTLTVTWSGEDFSFYDSFHVVLTQDAVESIEVKQDTIPQGIKSSAMVNSVLFANSSLEVIVKYNSGKEETLSGNALNAVQFTGFLHDKYTAVGETFDETITASYQGKSCTFDLPVTVAEPIAINLYGTINKNPSALDTPDLTALFGMITYADGMKTIQSLPADEYDVEYVNPAGNHSDCFQMYDTAIIVTYKEGGKEASVRIDGITVSQIVLDLPVLDSTLMTYNGEEQTKGFDSGFDSSKMKVEVNQGDAKWIEGALHFTAAGTYKITVTITDKNYIFSEGKDSVSHEFVVSKIDIDKSKLSINVSGWQYLSYTESNYPKVDGLPETVTQEDVTFRFYGRSADGKFNVLPENPQTLSSEQLSELGVGTYYVIASIRETENYNPYDIKVPTPFSVSKRSLAIPSRLDQVYNEKPQRANVAGLTDLGVLYTMYCESHTDVVDYDYHATFTLTDDAFANYHWGGKGQDVQSVTVTWRITQGQNQVVTVTIENADNWTYGDAAHEVNYTLTFKQDAVVTVTYRGVGDTVYAESKDVPTNAGTYVVKVSVEETKNYKGAEKEVPFTIKPKALDYPTVSDGGGKGYVYSGNVINVVLSAEYFTDDVTVSGNISPYFTVSGDFKGKDAKEYSFTLTPTANYCWTDGDRDAYTVTWEIIAKTLGKPTADSTQFVYNTFAQTYTLTGFDVNGMTISVTATDDPADSDGLVNNYDGSVKAVRAGTYKITVEPKTNYAFSGGVESYTYIFVIDQKPLTAPTPDNKTFTYDGSVQTYVLGGFVASEMVATATNGATVSGGSVTAKNAGTYEITVNVIDDNYKWAEDTNPTYDFIINRKDIQKPSVVNPDGYVYNYGEDIKVQISPESDGFTKSGDTTAKNVGTYTLTLTLDDNFVWSDGTSEPYNLTWKVVQRQISLPTLSDTQLTYNDETQTVTVYGVDENAVDLDLTASADGASLSGTTLSVLHAGTYTVKANLKNDNFVWASEYKDLVLTVAKATNAISGLTIAGWTYGGTANEPDFKASFGATTATVTYKGDGYNSQTAPENAGKYTVTVTIAETSDYAGATANVSFVVDRKGVTRPSITGEYDYSGKEQTVKLSTDGESQGYFTVEGGTQKNADTYTVTLKLSSNYRWSDDESEFDSQQREHVFQNGWTISPLALDAISLEQGETTVVDDNHGTPQAQTNLLVGFNTSYPDAYEITWQSDNLHDISRNGDTLTATNADTYTVTVALASTNFVWSDGGVGYILTWKINPKTVVVQNADVDRQIEYNGSAQHPDDIYDTPSPYYTASGFYVYNDGDKQSIGNDAPSNYGTYYMAFTLKNASDYVWTKDGHGGEGAGQSDSAEGAVIYVWFAITKAGYTITAELKNNSFTYGATLSPENDIAWQIDVQEVLDAIESGAIVVEYRFRGTALDGTSYGGEQGDTKAPKDAGTYTVTVYVNGETANYRAQGSAALQFTINPKQLTVTFKNENNGYTFTYGAAQPVSVTYSGFAYGEKEKVLDATVTYNVGGDKNPVNVGNYTVTAKFTNTNYVLQNGTRSATRSYVITKATLNVTVGSQTVVYGEALDEWTVTVEGWQYSDKGNLEAYLIAAVKAGISHKYKKGSGVGTYGITVTPADGKWSSNYTVVCNSYDSDTQQGAKITVIPRAITVTIADKTSVYGDDLEQLTATVSFTDSQAVTGTPVYGNDRVYDLVCDVTVGSAVDDYYITGKATNNNYDVTFKGSNGETGNYAVTEAEITVNAVGYNGTYDAVAHAVLNQDDSWTKVTHKSPFEPKWTFSFEQNGEYTTQLVLTDATDGTTVYYKVTDPNHDTATGYFTVKIAKASLTVKVDNATVQYGDDVDLSALTLTYSGWKGSDGVEQVDATGAKYTFVSAEGTHYAPGASAYSTFAITASGVTSDNYNITFGNDGTLTVLPRQITITLSAQTAEYGGQNASYTLGNVPGTHYTVGGKGLYDNEDPQVILTADLTSKDVGSYKIVASLPGNKNYSVTVKNEDNFLFTITKATVTVTAKNQTVTYGDVAPALSWTDVDVSDDFRDGSDYAAQLGAINFGFGDYAPRTSQAGSTYDITPIVGESTNYVVNTQTGQLTVAVRSITVTIEDKTSVYGSSIVELTATTQDTVANVDGLDNIVSLTKADGLNAGSYAISGEGKNDNYDVTFMGTNGEAGEYVITPKKAEITITLPTDLEYSGKPMTATASIKGLIDSDSALQATITYSGATYDGTSHANESDAPVKAGKYSVTATLPNHNYYLTTDGSGYVYDTSVDMEITKATLIVKVTVGTPSIQYGDDAPASSYSYKISGFKNNENEGVLTGRVVYSTSYAPGAEKGSVDTYTVTHDVDAADAFASNNYSFEAQAGSFEVTPREVSVLTVDNNLIANTFTYGSATGAKAQLTERLPQAIEGDDLGFVYTYSTEEEGVTWEAYPTWVGSYTVTVSVTNTNYKLDGGAVSKDYVITQKQVTVTADNLVVTYGDSVPTYTATYTRSDFAYDETEHTAGITGNLVFTCSYAPGAEHGSVGGYEITVSEVTSRNYSFNFENGTLTVQKKAITVTFSDGETTYGDEKYVYSQAEVTESALVEGDSKETVFDIKVVDASGTSVEFDERTAAGVYYLYGSEKSGNYAITFEGGHTVPNGVQNAGKHTVNQQTVSVKVTGTGDRLYDGTPKEVTAQITDGALFGETVTLTVYYTGKDGTSSTTAPKNVGTYAISVTADNPNYTSASVSGELIIKPETVYINWGETSFTYNGTEQTVKATYQTVAADGGNAVELKLTLQGYVAHGSTDSVTNVTFRDAGNYTYVASFADGDNPYGNYALQSATTHVYVIDRAKITVEIADKTSQYGDDIVALTAQVTSGDIFARDQGGTPQKNPVYILSTTATSASPVSGTYTITGEANGERGFNYDVTFIGSLSAAAQYTVTKRQLTVTATYNGNNEVTYGDAVTNSLFALSYERAGGGAAFVNDDDQSVVTVNPTAFVYTYQSGANGTPAGSVVKVTIDVSLLAAENYAFTDSQQSAFTVVKRVITLNENYKNFGGHTYDGSDIWLAATTQDVQNIVDGESVGNEVVFDYAFTYNGDSTAAAAVNAGNYVVTVTLNGDSANYTFDKDTITFEIAKRTLTVTPDGNLQQDGVQDITVTYGDKLTSEDILNDYLHYSGFVNGENAISTGIVGKVVVTQNYLYADAANRTDAGTTLTVTLDFEDGYAPQNYDVQFETGQITVLKRKINVQFTGNLESNHGYTVYGEYGKNINPAQVTVQQGLAEGDKAEEEITFSYFYFGTSNDGTWSYTAENAVTAHPTHAGTYSVRIEMESTNYEFANPDQGSDGSAHTEQNIYTVLKQRVTAPTWQVDSLPATGEEQENVISKFNNTLYEYITAGSDNNQTPSVQHSGNTVTMTATYAGSYWATFRLLDSDNYVWAALTSTEEGYDTPTIDVKWSISAYNDLTVEIVGVDLDGDGNADVLPTEGKFNHTWTYGDVFGTIIAKGRYNGGQSVFQGTITITFYLEGTDERVANCNSAGSYYVVASVSGTSDFNAAQSQKVYFTVNRKQVAIPKAASVIYDDGKTVSATLANFQNGIMSVVGVAQGVSYAIDGDGCTLSAINAGSYYVNVSLTDRNNYEWTDGTNTVKGVTWTVSRKTVQIPDLPLNVSHEFDNTLKVYDVDQSPYYTVSGTTSATNVGTYTVEVRLVNTSNYVWSDETTAAINVTWKITKAQNGFVTHYERGDWTYGDAASKETLPTMNFGIPTVSYFTDEARTQPYTGDFNQYTPAGTYYVTVRVEGTNNYTEIVDETHSFTVNQATNEFVGSYERDGWTYGDAASAETLPTAKFGTVTVTYYTDAECKEQYLGTFGMSTAAGTYYAKVTVAETNNYTALEEVKSFTVAKATAQAVWSAGDLTYNSTDKASVITATFYEKVSGSYVELQVTVTGGQMVNAGDYNLTAALPAEHANNYTLTNAEASYTVAKASVTVTLHAQSAQYTGQTPTVDQNAYSISGNTYEQDLGITLSIAAGSVNVGSYDITATHTNGNFNVNYVSAKFEITAAPLTVEITANGGSYGDVTAATAIAKDEQGERVETQIVLTYTGQSNDGESYNNTVAPQKAGSYVVTATLANANYALTGNNTATFTVSKARLVVEITTSAAYNGELQKATVKVTGGDESLYTLTNNGGTDVGNYPVSLTLQDTHNYVWYYNEAEFGGATLTVTFTITRAANAVTLTGVTGWTYGEQPVTPSATATFGNAILEYGSTADGVFTTEVPTEAGTYYVRGRVAETTNYYAAASQAIEFVISQATNAFVGSYDRDDWTYGDAAAAETLPTAKFGSVTVTYYTDADRLTPYNGAFDQNTPAGTYYVTVRVEGTNNYTEIVDETHSFTVNQATNEFVGSYERDGWTYGDAASAETLPTAKFGTVTVTYYTDAECKEQYLGTFGRATAAGTYYAKVTVAGTNNYTGLEATHSFTVAKATAQAVWSAGDLAYNNTDKKAVITATFYETVSGSYVALQVTITEGEMVNAGDYNLTAALPAEHANNYTLTNAEASYTVAKASVTVTLHAQSAQYTGQTPTVDQNAYSISGNTYEQDLGITLSIAAGSVNVGSYDITATHTNGNFNVNYVSAKFEITAAPLTVEITANGGSYGDVTAATAIAKDEQGERVETQIVLTYTGQSNDGESYNNTVAPQKAGSYVVTATLANANYALTGNNTATFTVSKARLVVEITTSAAYNGELQKATVKVTGGDESLYTLTNNGGTDVGNYPVSLTLQDTHNYVWYYNDAEFGGGTLTVNFNITIADNSVTVSGVNGWTYGEQAVIPSATATFGNATVMYSTAADGVYVTDVPVNAGTYFVKAVVAETANYRGAESKPQSFEIAKAQNGFVTHYERDDWTYGDAASKETLPTMNFGIPTVSYFTDEARTQPYTGDFNQYTPAGTYYVKITVEGSENFEALVSVIHSFTVHKKQVAKPTLQYASVVETGQTLQNRVTGLDDRVMQVINLQSGITSDGNGYVLTEKNPGVYSITVALSDNANYTWTDGGNESVTLSWTIRRAQLQAWTEDSQNRYPEAVVHSPQGIHPDFLLQVVAVAEEMYGNYDLSQFGRVSIAMGYEVSLFSGGAEVQPEGEITVRLRVSSDIDPQVHTLLHLRDGQWQEVDYVVTDGYAVFTTDALSPMLFVTATPMYLVWAMAALGCILVAELIVLAAAVKKRRQGRNN